MNKNPSETSRGSTLLRWLVAAAFLAALILSGLLTGLMHTAGLLYLVFGSAAAALMGFSRHEIGAAVKDAFGSAGPRGGLERSAYFWEAAARNAWILGVLGSALNFTIALGGASGGIQDVGSRMIQSYLVTLYGLVLAALCLVPATKLKARVEGGLDASDSGSEPVRTALAEWVIGYVLFAAVLGLTVYFLASARPQSGHLSVAAVIFHGPAFLVVFGGAVALALFMGANAGAGALTLGFALTGLIGQLMGFIQGLFGFVHGSVQEVSNAVAFIISVSTFTLLGLVAVAAPLEDREVMAGRRRGPRALSRTVWVISPLLVFLFLLLTFIMIITPMK